MRGKQGQSEIIMRKFTLALLTAANLFILAAPLAAEEEKEVKPGLNEETFSGLKWRGIGPALMSGRIADVAIDSTDRSTWYVGVGSGWRVENQQPRHYLDFGI